MKAALEIAAACVVYEIRMGRRGRRPVAVTCSASLWTAVFYGLKARASGAGESTTASKDRVAEHQAAL